MKAIKIISLALLFVVSHQSYSATHVITQSGFTFSPSPLTVNVGDIIRWEWTSGTHTTTSKSLPNGAAPWDSPLTATSTSFEYTVTIAGVYNYVCTPHEGMGMKGSFTAVNTTGLEEKKSLGFYLYPNPASNIINITSTADGEILLSDILGKYLNKIQLNELPVIGDSYQFDISDLKNGTYVITLLQVNGHKPKSMKFVKNE